MTASCRVCLAYRTDTEKQRGNGYREGRRQSNKRYAAELYNQAIFDRKQSGGEGYVYHGI